MGDRALVTLGLIGIALCLVSFRKVRTSYADRVFSPLDSLGDGAIDSTLSYGQPSGRNVTNANGAQFRLRYWPIDGLVLGTELGHLGTPKNTERAQGFMDPSFRAGYLEHLPLDIILRGDIRLTLPLGQELASLGRTSLEMEALIGFRGWKHALAFFRPILGYRSSGTLGHASLLTGWSAGLAYQRSRFSVSFSGATHWHLNTVRGARIGGAGTFAMGYELTPGLTLRWDINIFTEPEVDRGAGFLSIGGFGLEWVYFTGDRKNTYRTAPDDDDSSFSAAEHW
ncbi:MAG: hypothetical protein JKY56_16685 [Kofleriaceae bacterium]|nr:hypothetical protein [Kofleriaceae bacterium]